MTSRIALRKEQQRLITSSAPSLGYMAGEAVIEVNPVWSQGPLFLGGVAEINGILQVDKGLIIRAARSDGDVEQLTVPATTTFGDRITQASSAQLWSRRTPDTTISPDFKEFSSSPDLKTAYITLDAGDRPTVKRIITVTSANPPTYQISDGEVVPTWGGEFRPAGGTNPDIENDLREFWNNTRQIGIYDARGYAIRAQRYLEGLAGNTPFGNAVDIYNLDLNRQSTRERESYPTEFSRWPLSYFSTISVGDKWGLFIYGIGPSTTRPGKYSLFAQLTGWRPANIETKSGTPPFTGEGKLIVDVDWSLSFIDKDGATLHKSTQTLATDYDTQTLQFDKPVGVTTKAISATVDTNGHDVWMRSVVIPLPRNFDNAEVDTYNISRDDNETDLPLQIFGHAAPILVPSIARNTKSRPHEYLTYTEDPWDGTSFQKLRCRCPAWILYDVLTAEKWGIELDPTKINSQSFLKVSRYCMETINGSPRWVFDGHLSGTQDKVIESILMLMRGWLYFDFNGLLTLSIEKSENAKWVICPAIIGEGRIDYRTALPRLNVRTEYTDRLTGLQEITEGLDNTRTDTVNWQDSVVAERWAKWQTFSEQNLLDTVEFTLPWSFHKIAIGDLIDLYDPIHMNIRAAGRIIDSSISQATTESKSSWVQLDGLPLEYWPEQVAGASLLQTDRNAVIDQDLWGYVEFTLPNASQTIRISKPDGGHTDYTIARIYMKAGGRPSENRVLITKASTSVPDIDSSNRPVWSIFGTITTGKNINPTKWRVQSVSEIGNGREFGIVATKWIDGMHAHIEQDAVLPNIPTQWTMECGTSLHQFGGLFDDIGDRYPNDRGDPFGDGSTFDRLTTSCV